jgi:hypothetical protein
MMLADVKEWFERDLRPLATKRRWTIETTQDNADGLTWLITTADHLYTITASRDWIGCVCRTRFNKGGHPLFADLPDGTLTEETWKAIAEEIRHMERQSRRGPAL